MYLDPTYNNGVDPEIRQTNLKRPLTPEEWKLEFLRRGLHLSAGYEPPKLDPVQNAIDLNAGVPKKNYGMKSIPERSHMLPTGE